MSCTAAVAAADFRPLSGARGRRRSVPPEGAGFEINLENLNLGNQRYRLQQNLLEIDAQHPALKRYLGAKADGFLGQDEPHFRLLVAEIVAEAVCTKTLSDNIKANPEEYEDGDWELYYAEYTRLTSKFLPTAHKVQFAKP